VKRREFITLLGGAAATRPLAARAQQPERLRRIGVLMSLAADDPEGQARLTAFLQGLQELGWADGRNITIDGRSTAAGAKSRSRRDRSVFRSCFSTRALPTTFPAHSKLQARSASKR
jgi:putative ABC transport system substrate-binding protein